MDTVTWLKKLIAFDTTSHLSNLAMIDYIANYLESLKLDFFLNYNTTKNKANLFATLPDAKGNTTSGIVLSGHSDVVPVTGQDWDTDPFCAEIKDNRIYGRGTTDMKGFIAAVLGQFSFFKQQNLTRPIHLAISYDEEVSCLGIPFLLAEIKQQGITPKYCIVGEATSMQMVVAHKGHYSFKCEVHGKSAHSSLTPYGVNAIEYAAQLINFINQLAQQLKMRDDLDAAFDIAFSSLSVGKIAGGTAINIIPNYCEFYFDYRNLPHMSIAEVIEPLKKYIAEELEVKMQALDPNCQIKLQQLNKVPAMQTTQDKQLLQLMNRLLGPQQINKVGYATEGGYFAHYQIPTVICGPGDIKQAHQANEYIELSQLKQCDVFLQKLAVA